MPYTLNSKSQASNTKYILVIGIWDFKFEGKRRILQAMEGINNLKKNVDSLLVINNERLRDIHGNLELSEAFGYADNILTIAAKGIAEIITVHGHMNVDFADVNTVMSNSGV
ncbi:MAG TPA: cell division protein FtsZ, partial [Syntrophaceae bacterium]|nr:cell division protein FtsZ [Syntrophaceae bacterium]